MLLPTLLEEVMCIPENIFCGGEGLGWNGVKLI